jgi:hypothetical protein
LNVRTEALFSQQLFLSLLSSGDHLFLLDPSPLVFRHRLIELLAKLMEDLEAFLDLEGVGVLAEELGESSPDAIELLHVPLKLRHFLLGHLQELGHLILNVEFGAGQLYLASYFFYPRVECIELVRQLLDRRSKCSKRG